MLKASIVGFLMLVSAMTGIRGVELWDAPSATAALMGATVKIEVTLAGDHAAIGSGTVVYSRRVHGLYETYVLTNAHVVDEALTIKVLSYHYVGDDRADTATDEADIVKIDKKADLALLHFKRHDQFPVVAVMAGRDPSPLTHVIEIGCPMGVDPVVTEGIVSNIADGFIRESAPTYFGNSGGTLYDESHRFIGVPSEVIGRSTHFGDQILVPHLALAIPISAIRTFLKDTPLSKL